jgi:hypothetical protein
LHPAEKKDIKSSTTRNTKSYCLRDKVTVWLLAHTRSPEMSEYFFAGLNEGGASMVLSETVP